MIRNFVLESANAPGTNLSVLLGGPLPGRQSWRQAYPDGSQAFYFIDDGGQSEWGVGGVHWGTPNTVSRDTVIGNTAGTTGRLNFTGAIQIYNEIPGERMPFINGNVLSAPNAYLDPHAGGTPIGAGMDFYGTVAPSGWVFANGQALSRTAYPFLFAVLSTTYGAPDANTFSVPNRCESFAVGRAFMGGALGAGRMPSIANIGVLGAVIGHQDLQAHTHVLNWSDPGHGHAVADPGHAHGLSDPGHLHTYRRMTFPPGSGFQAGSGSTPTEVFNNTDDGGVRGTGMSLAGALTGIGIFGSFTGISASIAASGVGNQGNIPPAVVCNHILYCGPIP